jgi:hypothetical protein
MFDEIPVSFEKISADIGASCGLGADLVAVTLLAMKRLKA